MMLFNLNSRMTFGKFKGNTLREILDLQPSYLEWCAINVDFFCLTNETLEEIEEILLDFKFINESKQLLNEKKIKWDAEEKKRLEEENKRFEEEEKRDNDNESHYRNRRGFLDDQSSEFYDQYQRDDNATYNNYRGSYAQDIEGWSDQDIRDVLEGDPSAYWNID